jgi:hypothetical protein
MIAFHTNGNLILQQAFKSKSDRYCIAAYNAIMLHLTARGLSVDFQILDNKASVAYKVAITLKRNAKFQLVLRIAATGLNALFAHSRAISLQYWPASISHFPRTIGAFFCYRLNSPSTSPASHTQSMN